MFKVGDKVICIDDSDMHSNINTLVKGKIYTISHADTGYDDMSNRMPNITTIILKELDGLWYNHRFKKYNYRKEKLQRICLK